jgi:hypothetical protein
VITSGVVQQPPMTRFKLLQLRALVRGEFDCNLAVRFAKDLMNAASRLGPDRFELGRRLLDCGRDFFYLFVGQPQLKLKTMAHSVGDYAMIFSNSGMASLRCGDKCASHPARDEHENESGDQPPFQAGVHWLNSS